jgi:hypothetical protein
MLVSSQDFVKNYMWKYVDITINKEELKILKKQKEYNPSIHSLFSRYRDIFVSEMDMENYLFVMSIIENSLMNKFLIFTETNIKRFYFTQDSTQMGKEESILTLDDLDRLIDNEDKFKLLLISLYYYF